MLGKIPYLHRQAKFHFDKNCQYDLLNGKWEYEYGYVPLHTEISILLQKIFVPQWLLGFMLDYCSQNVKNDIPSQTGLSNCYS